MRQFGKRIPDGRSFVENLMKFAVVYLMIKAIDQNRAKDGKTSRKSSNHCAFLIYCWPKYLIYFDFESMIKKNHSSSLDEGFV